MGRGQTTCDAGGPGLDFADCEAVFAGRHFSRVDDRQDYGEQRVITAGYLGDRFVVVVWTPRDGGRQIISVKHGHEWEEARFRDHLA